jgi:hypothetical protein
MYFFFNGYQLHFVHCTYSTTYAQNCTFLWVYHSTCGIRGQGGKGAQGLKQQSPTTILSLILLFSSCLSSLRKSLIHCLFQFGSQLLYVEDLPFGIIFQYKLQVYLKTSIILLYMYVLRIYCLCQENY